MISVIIASISSWLERITGVEGILGYLAIAVCAFVGNIWFNNQSRGMQHVEEEEEEEPDPPRNFTVKQLRQFDGSKETTGVSAGEDKPVYLSLNGIVFDVTRGKDFYGPGGPYEVFAGRECGVALAKMSFDAQYLDNVAACDDLNAGERGELENWIDQFTHYKCYPVLGRLIPDNRLPPSERIITIEELRQNDGSSNEIPEGYATQPIYLGVQDKVFDVSFGGVTMYGKECSYNRFAGRDASRALAKMSFDPADLENTNVDDLPDKQRQVLEDWAQNFQQKKRYPVVGRIEK